MRAPDRLAGFICWPEIGDHDREREDLSAGIMNVICERGGTYMGQQRQA